MLLAALDARRVTRDIDALARGIAGSGEELLDSIRRVTAHPTDDGLAFRVDEARMRVIREDATYSGTRVTMPVHLSRARSKLVIDVSVGDPVVPGPQWIEMPLQLGGAVRLLGYPLEAVLAEKIVTAVSLGDLSARDRDYADVWRLPRTHNVDGASVIAAVRATATYRGVQLRRLSGATTRLPEVRQVSYRRWCSRQPDQRPAYPEQFRQVVAEVVAFADPVLDGSASGLRWSAAYSRWEHARLHDRQGG